MSNLRKNYANYMIDGLNTGQLAELAINMIDAEQLAELAINLIDDKLAQMTDEQIEEEIISYYDQETLEHLR